MNKLLPFLALAFCASIFAQNNKITLDDGIEITSIDDAPREMDASLFSGKLTEKEKQAYFKNGKTPSSVNVFLVKSAGKTYLIDAGFGNAFKDKRIDPKTISAVFITHKHGDHISGLMQNNAPVFKVPVSVSKIENEKMPSEGFKDYKTFNFGDTVAPGIVAMDAVGHTPGHTAFLIGTGKQKLLIAADYLHAASLQFPHPTESASFDADKEQAVKTRISLMQQAEKNGWFIAGSHVPNPGWGKIKSDGKGGFVLE